MKRLLILLLLILSSPVYAKTLEMMAVDYPPYTSPSALNNGVMIEIVTKVFEGTGIMVKPLFLPPKRVHRYMDEGKYLSSFYGPEGIKKDKRFRSLPMIKFNMLLFYNKKRLKLSGDLLADLKGKKVSLLTGSQLQYQAFFKKYEMVEDYSNSMESMFRKLEVGRVDYGFSVDLTAIDIMNQLGLDDNTLAPLNKVFFSAADGPYFNISSEEGKEIFDLLNKNFEKIKNNGTYEQIVLKHYKSKAAADKAMVE